MLNKINFQGPTFGPYNNDASMIQLISFYLTSKKALLSHDNGTCANASFSRKSLIRLEMPR